MKKQYNGKKLRYGSSSLVLTAAFIAAVIVLNILVTSLSNRYGWYIDMTQESIYSISDDCFDLLREEAITRVDEVRETSDKADEELVINILFMAEADILNENDYMRRIYQNALELQREFPQHVTIENINLQRNPSRVQKYRTSPNVSINTAHVVVEFGTEYRLIPYSSFYRYNSGDTSAPWAYDGEKRFASSILAVTQSESPVCLIDDLHGENPAEFMELIYALEDAGYLIALTSTFTYEYDEDNQPIEGTQKSFFTDEVIERAEKIMENEVRMMLIFDPKADFMVKSKTSDIDEIGALDRFLDGKSSMMVFMDPETPVAPNLEEYLDEWGISFDRVEETNNSYMIRDMANTLTADGFSVIGEYFTAGGNGANLTSDMRKVSYPKKVIFRNAMSISYSSLFTETQVNPNGTAQEVNPFRYGAYYGNGVERTIHDVFVSSASAEAMAGGKIVDAADETNRFRLMTISSEGRYTQEDNYGTTLTENSYVLACGSTAFASEAYLQSAVYGNYDLLLTAMTIMGREPVPVGLTMKAFADYSLDSITVDQQTAWTVALAAIPAAISLIVGVVVLVKRKYA